MKKVSVLCLFMLLLSCGSPYSPPQLSPPPEEDIPIWNEMVTYTKGVKVEETWLIYLSLQSNNKGHRPSISADWWRSTGETRLVDELHYRFQ